MGLKELLEGEKEGFFVHGPDKEKGKEFFKIIFDYDSEIGTFTLKGRDCVLAKNRKNQKFIGYGYITKFNKIKFDKLYSENSLTPDWRIGMKYDSNFSIINYEGNIIENTKKIFGEWFHDGDDEPKGFWRINL